MAESEDWAHPREETSSMSSEGRLMVGGLQKEEEGRGSGEIG